MARLHLRHLILPALAALGVASFASPAAAMRLLEDEERGRFFDLGGYIQPYFSWVADPCVPAASGDGTCREFEAVDGFGLERGRINIAGGQDSLAEFHIELTAIPDVQLIEAEVKVHLYDGLALRFGRYRVPYSGQELVSESRLQLTRSQLIRATPGRQLGISLRYEMPEIGPLPNRFIVAEGGVFNGESDKERAPIANIDSEFLWGGRLEINPFGDAGKRYEGDLRPLDERRFPVLTLGGNYARRRDDNLEFTESAVGGDIGFKIFGLSLYGEMFRRNRNFDSEGAGFDQYSYGWNAQIGYMIPGPWVSEHLEIAARVEQFDPEQAARVDDRVAAYPSSPGAGPAAGGVEQQAQRNYTGALNVYLRGHDFKVQLIYTHREAIEGYKTYYDNPTADIPLDVDDDSFVVQATYRF